MQQKETFREIYDFYRIVKVQKYAKRYKRNSIRQDNKTRKKLRESLVVGKKVFVLAERLKKMMRQMFFIREQLRINHFLTKTRYFLLEELIFLTILIIIGF